MNVFSVPILTKFQLNIILWGIEREKEKKEKNLFHSDSYSDRI